MHKTCVAQEPPKERLHSMHMAAHYIDLDLFWGEKPGNLARSELPDKPSNVLQLCDKGEGKAMECLWFLCL